MRDAPPLHLPAFSGLHPGLTHAAAWLAAVVVLALVSHAAETIVSPRAAEVAGAEADAAAVPHVAPTDRQPVMPALGAHMRKVLDYTSRRYRLSPLALEPVFVAVERRARELGIDPLLVIAVIGIESGFNPFAESVMGAQGLMQVIPRYHADKLPPEQRTEAAARLALLDPVVNVRVGTHVLHDYIRTTGDVVEGLQQFAGALGDPEQGYATKVLVELDRLEIVAQRPHAGSI